MQLPIQSDYVSSLAFHPNGQHLAAAILQSPGGSTKQNDHAEIEVWDLANSRVAARMSGGSGVIANMEFDPQGGKLAAAYYHEGAIRVFESNTGRLIFKRELATPATSVAFSPRDGRRLAGTGFDGLVRLWDSETGREAFSLRGLGPPGSGNYNFTPRAVFSSDGRRLAANDWDGTVTIWDAGSAISTREH